MYLSVHFSVCTVAETSVPMLLVCCTEAESEGGGGFPAVNDSVLNQYFVVILGTSNILTSAKN